MKLTEIISGLDSRLNTLEGVGITDGETLSRINKFYADINVDIRLKEVRVLTFRSCSPTLYCDTDLTNMV